MADKEWDMKLPLVGERSVIQNAYTMLDAVVHHAREGNLDSINIEGIEELLVEFNEVYGGKIELVPFDPSDDEYDESMDGDHRSALASAGWGTDEDYGGTDEHC